MLTDEETAELRAMYEDAGPAAVLNALMDLARDNGHDRLAELLEGAAELAHRMEG